MKTSLLIPVYQAEKYIEPLFSSLEKQTCLPEKILIIDSSSTDRTIEKIKAFEEHSLRLKGKIEVEIIPKSEFNHGGTRHLGTQLAPADLYIFMTQDAILADSHSLETLMNCYQNPAIGCAYGRQLPHQNATLLARHARLFNYPKNSITKSYEDREVLGVKTYFNSDSFSSYRHTAYQDAEGFPNHTILAEDGYLAAKMLMKGWKIQYCAEAIVFHSHNYSPWEEFKRYFDIGVFYASEPWLLERFASPQKEGRRYIFSEWKMCLREKAWLALIASVISIGAKLTGYKLGRHFKKLPRKLCKKLSMHKGFWGQ